MNARDYFTGAFARILGRPLAITAAAGQDNTEQTGAAIALSPLNNPKTLSVVIAFKATLAAAATLTLKNVRLVTGPTSSPATVLATATASVVVATGPGGGGSREGCYRADFDLSGADEYVALQYTPDLSAGSVDTCNITAVGMFGGGVIDPASILGVQDAGHEVAYTP